MQIWSSVVCDGCDAWPLLGPRFTCRVSPDYDLCAACAQKAEAKERSLQLQPAHLSDQITLLKHASQCGRWVNGKLHGRAIAVGSTGVRYEGMFKDSRREGLGVLSWKDGWRYEGEFVAGQLSGLGAEWNEDGTLVKCGRWENSQFKRSRAVPLRLLPEGKYLSSAALQSKCVHPNDSALLTDGTHYVGQLNAHGLPHGQGESFHPSGSPQFTMLHDTDAAKSGRWVNGIVHGRAIFVWPNGDRFVGLCKDGLSEGLGVTCWKDGSRYEGEFVADESSGLGAKWDKDGKLVQCGRWSDNELVESRAVPLRCIHEGKYLSAAALQAKRDHPDDSALLADGTHYIGTLNAHGLPHGQGSTFYPDGSLEVRLLKDAADSSNTGQWIDGSVLGRAQQTHTNGDFFDGSFKDGLYDGVGVLDASDGRYEGQFAAGERCGFGVRWDANGAIEDCGRWEDGELVDSCAVPVRLLPDKHFLSSHAESASLLFPDGGYFIGPINPANQRVGFGRMFDDSEDLIDAGTWIDDTLQCRKALLIGNDKYAEPVQQLHCCKNDAIDMQSALKELDFDCTLLLDASRREMTDAITAFIASLRANDLVFISFSGHGAEGEANIHLIPTDFKDGSHQYDAVGLNSILCDPNRKDCNLTSIIVLDCCRADDNNLTFRSVSPRAANNCVRSPTTVDRCVRLPTTGTFFIVKASDPGTVAHEDRDERNGWFTGCLLRYLTEPGLRLTQIFGKTGVALKKKSKGLQRSWITVTDQLLADDLVLKQGDEEE